jgi:two-component system response regulator NreC
MPVSVLLADDHEILRQGVRVLLDRAGFNVVAEASDGHEAVELAGRLKPDIAVLDYVMPGLNGRDAALRIQQVSRQTRTILLTMRTEREYVLDAMRIGLSGYVVKSQAVCDLVNAIHEVRRNGVYLSPRVSAAVVDACYSGGAPQPELLTPREREVLQLIAEGQTTKEVAVSLDLSVKTAETHRTKLMRKLNIHQTAGLVRYAIRRGMISA